MSSLLDSYSSSINVPIASIIAYHILAFIPHLVAARIASGGDPSSYDNVSPRSASFAEKLKKKLGPKKFGQFERAKACHQNSNESMPLFIAAVFAGYLAEQRLASPAYGGLTPAAAAAQIGLTKFVIGWFTARTLYTVNYLTVESLSLSALRSALWGLGNGWAFFVLFRAAKALV